MTPRRARPEREPTIALINIVFLMLIFFLVAGTLAAPLDKDLRLVSTAKIDRAAPADALVLHADGRMTRRGTEIVSAAAFLADLPEEARARVRIVPDRALPAQKLVGVARALREAGAGSVVLVTERGLQ
ncbi:biopolymer transporter ExbD [Lutimaribacter sp. EGI FJ00015]|uniref:Biopolymer transporter ExbD n=1 Tax=Lutimaribacter degradans TaxID=2945989 RepID=A0ACC5ZVQ3_9RHOB|nr:biopolymer transporter ExbD [Lutimaribacter sp. EGI FJ00013]MCM2562023.1 biopolymer transporter ExbD [Lutimaribacter sp. EGI FJ00013]MCO0612945.1 biopolymer transporter ExbD [Lutimaribacter sp. EGI FJ00015]MCO0635855.1 biopolymer transporter ExbD [Lutimaribacter sp. EGI FJ00014]